MTRPKTALELVQSCRAQADSTSAMRASGQLPPFAVGQRALYMAGDELIASDGLRMACAAWPLASDTALMVLPDGSRVPVNGPLPTRFAMGRAFARGELASRPSGHLRRICREVYRGPWTFAEGLHPIALPILRLQARLGALYVGSRGAGARVAPCAGHGIVWVLADHLLRALDAPSTWTMFAHGFELLTTARDGESVTFSFRDLRGVKIR